MLHRYVPLFTRQSTRWVSLFLGAFLVSWPLQASIPPGYQCTHAAGGRAENVRAFGLPKAFAGHVKSSDDPIFTNWTQRASALRERAEGQSIVYANKVYVFGGFAPALKISNSNEVYDPATNQWTLLAPMPSDPQGKPYAVTHNGIALVDNTIWIAGGRVGNNPGPVTDKVWIYSIASNSWTEGPRLPAPRAGGGLVRLGRKLYLFGGFGTLVCNNDYGDQFVYDLDNPSAGWQTGLAPMPNPRNHFGTTTVGGKIYAIGGQYGHDCGGGQDVKLVHEYDPATNVWTRKTDLPYATSHIEPGTFGLDGKVWVTGGQFQGTNVLQYDPAGNAWQLIDQLPNFLVAASGKVINNDFIVSHGGIRSTQYPESKTWLKTVTRTRNNALSFWPDQLSLSAVAGGSPVTATVLLGTISGNATFTVNTAGLPGWLSIDDLAGSTDESGASVRLTLNPAGLPGGTYTHSLTASAPGYTNATLTISFAVSGGGSTQVLARINAGGPAVTTDGISWSASQYFSGGVPFANSNVTAIAGTNADVLYQTEYSSASNLAGFTFAMPVPRSGMYTVKLHFAEIYWGATGGRAGGAGQRVFTVNLEGGNPELVNYDINAEVGTMTAQVKTIDVFVGDGTLSIDFAASVNRPKISAIEVLGNADVANSPPVLATVGSKTVVAGNTLTLLLTATDPDGDAVTFTATNLPSFASLSAATLTVSPGAQAAGTYPITVNATDSKGATDQETFTLVVSNVAAPALAVTNFTLVNADTEQDIRVLTNQEVINLATLPTTNLNIRANTNPGTVGSVVLTLSGPQNRAVTETDAPYALYGDSKGNYNAWKPATGTYTLTATPFTEARGGGTEGAASTLAFSVVNNASGRVPFWSDPTAVPESSWRFYPNPVSDKLSVHVGAGHVPPLTIQITNMLGQTMMNVRKQDRQPENWSVTDWPAGLYFISVRSEAGIETRKLVKQ